MRRTDCIANCIGPDCEGCRKYAGKAGVIELSEILIPKNFPGVESRQTLGNVVAWLAAWIDVFADEQTSMGLRLSFRISRSDWLALQNLSAIFTDDQGNKWESVVPRPVPKEHIWGGGVWRETGETRIPQLGEAFWSPDGTVGVAGICYMSLPIVKLVRLAEGPE